MNKTVIPIILGILLINLASALTLHAGDYYTWNLDNEFVKYSITGNSSDLEGLNFTNTINSLTVNIAQNYKPDNWTIKITTKEEVIEKTFGGGGTFIPKPISKEEVIEGIKKLLSVGSSYNFEINGQTHEFTILNVTENSATIRIRSNEIILTLKLNETKTICLDNKEIEVTLNEVRIFETISYAETTLKNTDRDCELEEPIEPIEPKEPIEETKNNLLLIFFIIGVIVSSIVIIILVKRKKIIGSPNSNQSSS